MSHIFQINSNLDALKFLLLEIVILILYIINGYARYYSKIAPTFHTNTEQKIEYGIVVNTNTTQELILPFWLRKNSNLRTEIKDNYFDIFLSIL